MLAVLYNVPPYGACAAGNGQDFGCLIFQNRLELDLVLIDATLVLNMLPPASTGSHRARGKQRSDLLRYRLVRGLAARFARLRPFSSWPTRPSLSSYTHLLSLLSSRRHILLRQPQLPENCNMRTMLQESFDNATKSYKVRVGNREAWSNFYKWFSSNVKNIPENEESKEQVHGVFIYIEQDPELLVCLSLPLAKHGLRRRD
jgi:hypothetical protein